MREALLDWLRGIRDDRLRLIPIIREGDQITEGVLWEPDGYWYPIIRGVPCLLRGALRPNDEEFRVKHGLPRLHEGSRGGENVSQARTSESFSDKWRRFQRYGLEPEHQRFLYSWYCRKLGVKDETDLRDFYGSKRAILEVGPGSGFNSRYMATCTTGTVIALDISEAAFTTFENTLDLANCHVVRADLMEAPLEDETFDLVFADGVLHHTPDTRKAVFALYRKLAPGGHFFFYVYRRMGPLRYFCDQYVRSQFTTLEPERCYEACEGFTELGRELSRLDATITLEKGIPILGIPPGTHDVQRLVYYNFVKCFWNEAFDFETNNMVNFDWYHPHDAWQHTEKEVRAWLLELGVEDYRFNDANPNGISVLLKKPESAAAVARNDG